MAESLNRVIRQHLVWACVALSAAIHAPQIGAQALADPMKPPASLRAGQDGEAQAAAAGPVLQSVLVSPGRKVAIISGQTVTLGDKYGDARVTKITESEVTLRGGNGVQILKLYPGVEKDVTSNRKQPKAEGRRQ